MVVDVLLVCNHHLLLQLPDEEGRLLIMHGTMDENVHFMQVSCFKDSFFQVVKNVLDAPYRIFHPIV